MPYARPSTALGLHGTARGQRATAGAEAKLLLEEMEISHPRQGCSGHTPTTRTWAAHGLQAPQCGSHMEPHMCGTESSSETWRGSLGQTSGLGPNAAHLTHEPWDAVNKEEP